ncbi:hypothetical protein GT348_05890 [Aristophania vespae]|uniref:Uncharacterized protein n=1 Tax=Aristophania vespae TaxID=2697033 RepID=A0A6P1NEF3_9PROT|nr:hypothetical protein [Aristophania vespae]QHI95838.1 hypothetical protein GT348_05890 [Aristophania vespae]UMM63555.1 hypothetical protein DM15PD_05290 [Aristophania vespae]
MAKDSHPLDQKELRLLADILALVLDDEAGQAQAALDRLRHRARQQEISGGSFKNLIISLAETSAGSDTLLKKRHELEIQRYKDVMEELATQHRNLQRHVALLERDNQIIRYNHSQQHDILPWQRIRVIIALLAGILLGIAASQIVHNIGSAQKIDRALCFTQSLSHNNSQ